MWVHVPIRPKDSNAAVGVRDRATQKAPEGYDRQINFFPRIMSYSKMMIVLFVRRALRTIVVFVVACRVTSAIRSNVIHAPNRGRLMEQLAATAWSVTIHLQSNMLSVYGKLCHPPLTTVSGVL